MLTKINGQDMLSKSFDEVVTILDGAAKNLKVQIGKYGNYTFINLIFL